MTSQITSADEIKTSQSLLYMARYLANLHKYLARSSHSFFKFVVNFSNQAYENFLSELILATVRNRYSEIF